MPFHDLGRFNLSDFESRSVWVYAPPGDEPEQVRPLLVLLDGQNAFEYGPAGGWESHLALDACSARSTHAPRIAAVPHGAARAEELCAWPTWPGGPGGPGGRAFAFIDRLCDTILPALRSRFHTPSGAVGAVLGGASWGGSAALVGHYARPDAWGGALCHSPAFWVGRMAIFDWIANRPTPSFSRIWLDCGRHEAGGRMFPLVEQMTGVLLRRGYPEQQLRWRPDEQGEHNEAHWRRRFPEALEFMYG